MANATPSDQYIERAKALSKVQVGYRIARIRGDFGRKLDEQEFINCLALLLEKEDEDLLIWRERFADLRVKHSRLNSYNIKNHSV